MADRFQYHLRGKHYSGRAVRVEPLPGPTVDKALLDAAKVCGKEATIFEVTKVQHTMGLRQMIKEISTPYSDPSDSGVKWKTVTPEDLDDLSEFFTSKDLMILQQIFVEFHEVTKQELDDIVGKAVPVAG
jgi:hypothetical protein